MNTNPLIFKKFLSEEEEMSMTKEEKELWRKVHIEGLIKQSAPYQVKNEFLEIERIERMQQGRNDNYDLNRYYNS